MSPLEPMALVLAGLMFLIIFLSWASMPEPSYKPSRCAVHEWALMDEQGYVDSSAPQFRKLNATMICVKCGKLPRRKEDGEL